MYSATQTLKPGYRPGRKGKVFCESTVHLHCIVSNLKVHISHVQPK